MEWCVARSGDSTNVQIHTQLDCKEYGGEYDALQQTDAPCRNLVLARIHGNAARLRLAKVHFNSVDGKAVFNWRMVP